MRGFSLFALWCLYSKIKFCPALMLLLQDVLAYIGIIGVLAVNRQIRKQYRIVLISLFLIALALNLDFLIMQVLFFFPNISGWIVWIML